MLQKKHGKQEKIKIKGVNLEVNLHTKLKHKIISYYFSAWKNTFKSRKIYTLYYVDLFAGDGICICKELDKEIEKYKDESYFKFIDMIDGEELEVGLKGVSKIQISELASLNFTHLMNSLIQPSSVNSGLARFVGYQSQIQILFHVYLMSREILLKNMRR